MSVGRGPWSREPEGRSTVGAAGLLATCYRRVATRRGSLAFTLIEMLIVIALVALLSALLVPSLQGLFGVAGRRGGANALSAALEQARLSAVENGTSAYVGFATASTNQDAKYNAVIVFRARRDDESGAAFVPLSRWLRLPIGVHLQPASILSAATTSVSSLTGVLPRLGTEQLASVPAIEFDRFGRLKNQGSANSRVLVVGEGVVVDASTVQFRSGTNAYALTVLPLTGRVQIADTDASTP
jgi:prepilin-type N-terminal cleavage/methylation domain-containing protein